jgi:sporulation protein YlmC with PRC-barrel domain
MNKLMTATAMALALGIAAPAFAQGANDARGGEAMAAGKSAAPAGQAGSSAATTTPSTADAAWYGRFSADELIGKDVVNAKGDEVGEIEDVVIDPASKAMYAIVSVGGFLGMGDKDVALSFDQLRLGADDAILMSEQSEDQLKQLPAYDKSRYEKIQPGQPLGSARE